VVRAGSAPSITLDYGGPPVGVLPEAHYDEDVIYLAPGDTVALYTDGVVDTAGSDLMDSSRIAEVLAAYRGEPVQGAANALMAEVTRLSQGTVADDVALLVLRARRRPAADVDSDGHRGGCGRVVSNQ